MSDVGLIDIVAALMFVGVLAYAIFGGADFGSGVWDLLAGDARHGGAVRAQIDHSIGPVWEANHVWLIYILVFMWTAFPLGFTALMTTLFIPWLLVGLGIVARGAGFAFRKYAASLRSARLYGAIFAGASLFTPFFLGMIAGAVASGRVPLEGGDLWTSWTGPASWVGGVLAVVSCAFLAACFLTADAARAGHDEVVGWMRPRALVSGAVAGVVAITAAVTLHLDAPTLAERLRTRGAGLVALSAIAGVATMVWLWQRRYALARVAAVVAVGSIVAGWGVAQWPDLLVDTAPLDLVAGARPTLVGLIVVFGIAAVTAVPALIWLYVLVNTPRWSED